MIYTHIQSKNLTLIIIALLGLAIAFSMREIFPAFLGAIVLYVLFKPLHLYLLNKKAFRPWSSATIVLVLSALLVIIPFLFLIWIVSEKIIDLGKHPEIIDNLILKINSLIGYLFHDSSYLKKTMQRLQEMMLGFFPSVVNSFFNILLLIAVTYFLLYFMLVEYKIFEKALLKYLPIPEKNALQLGKELKNITYSNIVGQGCIAVVQGTLQALGFLIFGLQDPLFWGIITLFLCFLPVVGAPIVFVPVGIIAIISGNTFSGVGILLWGFILVTNVDNLLLLIIAQRLGNIHPVITILGVIIGIPFFGILGLVFGPLLFSYFILLIKVYELKYIEHVKGET